MAHFIRFGAYGINLDQVAYWQDTPHQHRMSAESHRAEPCLMLVFTGTESAGDGAHWMERLYFYGEERSVLLNYLILIGEAL